MFVQTHMIHLRGFKKRYFCFFYWQNGSHQFIAMRRLQGMISSEQHVVPTRRLFVQRTDGELLHLVHRQSPEAQYQQNQWASVGTTRGTGGAPRWSSSRAREVKTVDSCKSNQIKIMSIKKSGVDIEGYHFPSSTEISKEPYTSNIIA